MAATFNALPSSMHLQAVLSQRCSIDPLQAVLPRVKSLSPYRTQATPCCKTVLEKMNLTDAIQELQSAAEAARADNISPEARTMITVLETLLESDLVIATLRQGRTRLALTDGAGPSTSTVAGTPDSFDEATGRGSSVPGSSVPPESDVESNFTLSPSDSASQISSARPIPPPPSNTTSAVGGYTPAYRPPSPPPIISPPRLPTASSSVAATYNPGYISPPADIPQPQGIPQYISAKDPSRKWYAIFVGTEVGVVQGVDNALAYANGVSGNSWKGFKTREEAEFAYKTALERKQVHKVY